MRLELAARAAASAARIDARWRRKADYPDRFAEELLETLIRIRALPVIGTSCPTSRHPSLRRLVMARSRCHVYFKVDEPEQLVKVLEIWDARRGKAARL